MSILNSKHLPINKTKQAELIVVRFDGREAGMEISKVKSILTCFLLSVFNPIPLPYLFYESHENQGSLFLLNDIALYSERDNIKKRFFVLVELSRPATYIGLR